MNNNVMDNNIMALREKLPDYIEDIINKVKEQSVEYQSEVMVDQSAKGEKIISVFDKNSDRWIYLNSRYDAEYAATKWAKSLTNIKYRSVHIVLGMSNGMYITQLLQVAGKQNDIIVYEPDFQLFLTVLENIDMCNVIRDSRVHFIVSGINDAEFPDIFEAVCTYERANYSNILFSPNYLMKYNEKILSIVTKCEAQIRSIEGDASTLYRYGSEMNDNIIRNIQFLGEFSSINILREEVSKIDGYEHIPAIIVGAGPSLDDNIMELKNSMGKSFIIAVDSAIRMLLQYNIIPDIIITVDSHKPMVLFEDDRVKDIPLVVCMQSRYEILSVHRAPMILFAAEELSFNLYRKFDKELSVLFTGGSVANNAFSLARFLGLKNIIFVGQDMAFKGNEKHASIVYEEGKVDYPDHAPYAMVKDVNGNDILTFANFKVYKEWFENQIAKMKDFRVINATEGGAMIKGTEIMTLKEANAMLCVKSVDIESVVKNVHRVFNDEERKELHATISNMADNGQELDKLFHDCINKYRELERLADEGQADSAEFNEIYKQIQQANYVIDNSAFMCLVEMYSKEEEYNALKDIYDAGENVTDVAKEVHCVAQKGIKLLEVYIESNEIVLKNLNATIAKMVREF